MIRREKVRVTDEDGNEIVLHGAEVNYPHEPFVARVAPSGPSPYREPPPEPEIAFRDVQNGDRIPGRFAQGGSFDWPALLEWFCPELGPGEALLLLEAIAGTPLDVESMRAAIRLHLPLVRAELRGYR